MNAKALRLAVLGILYDHARTGSSELLQAKDISSKLEGTTFQDIERELENLESLGLVKLARKMGGNHSAWITPKGRLHWEQVLDRQKREQAQRDRPIGFRPSKQQN